MAFCGVVASCLKNAVLIHTHRISFTYAKVLIHGLDSFCEGGMCFDLAPTRATLAPVLRGSRWTVAQGVWIFLPSRSIVSVTPLCVKGPLALSFSTIFFGCVLLTVPLDRTFLSSFHPYYSRSFSKNQLACYTKFTKKFCKKRRNCAN